jgi:xanthine dehydrogenase accessory factor
VSVQGTFAQLASTDGRAALITVLTGPLAGERVLIAADGQIEGGLSDAELQTRAFDAAQELMWEGRSERRDELFIDIVAPNPRLLIFGAVEYASYLSQFARVVGWRPYVIDPRAQFATRERFPYAIEVVAAWPREAIAQLGALDPATYIAVLTHDPKIDDEVLLAALEGEPAYIGAMGSKRAQASRRERLLGHGVSEEDLQRISAPIGLDLGAVEAGEVAVSILAEVLAVRHGRDAGRLSRRMAPGSLVGGRIH